MLFSLFLYFSEIFVSFQSCHHHLVKKKSNFFPLLFIFFLFCFRWWVCWTPGVFHISPKATMPFHLWQAAWSPLLAWPPAVASAWTISRAWRVWPVSPPCRLCPLCPAPSLTAHPPTAHRATPSTTWRPTSTASTDKVRSIDFTFSFYKNTLNLLKWFLNGGIVNFFSRFLN